MEVAETRRIQYRVDVARALNNNNELFSVRLD